LIFLYLERIEFYEKYKKGELFLKRKLHFMLIFVLIVSVLAGCTSANETNSENTSEGTNEGNTSESTAKNNEESNKVIDDGSENIEITMLSPVYQDPGLPKDHPVIQKLEEELNITLDIQWVPFSNFREKLSVLAASNSMPDIYRVQTPDYIEWRDKGIFLDVKPYLDQYPNLANNLPDEAWPLINPKGKYYGIPYYDNKYRDSLAIRKDWLDNLGLSMPETIDEFYEVAKAFATQDPDGNGKDDTFGFSIAALPNGNFVHAEPLMGAFGLGNGWKEVDGKLIPNHAQVDELKTFIGFLRKAYSEGVLDKDFAVLKPLEPKKKFDAGKSGIQQINPPEVETIHLKNLKELDPNAEVVQLVPPKGPGGGPFTRTFAGSNKIVINAKIDEKKQQRILKLLDYMASEEGYDLIKNGVEGIHYKKGSDGTYEKAWDDINPGVISQTFFRIEDPAALIKKYDDQEKLAKVSPWWETNAKYPWENPAIGLPNETEANDEYDFRSLNTKWMSTMVKVIVGKEPLEAIDQAVEEWLANGGQDLIDQVNELNQERQ
jgi:putative aldouronate transport system substrate-binding protein